MVGELDDYGETVGDDDEARKIWLGGDRHNVMYLDRWLRAGEQCDVLGE